MQRSKQQHLGLSLWFKSWGTRGREKFCPSRVFLTVMASALLCNRYISCDRSSTFTSPSTPDSSCLLSHRTGRSGSPLLNAALQMSCDTQIHDNPLHFSEFLYPAPTTHQLLSVRTGRHGDRLVAHSWNNLSCYFPLLIPEAKGWQHKNIVLISRHSSMAVFTAPHRVSVTNRTITWSLWNCLQLTRDDKRA